MSDPEPTKQRNAKPPTRNWDGMHSLCDFKLSNMIEIFLTTVLVCVGVAQVIVYIRMASIMSAQTEISQRQIKLMEADQRPWISLDMQPEGPLTRDSDGGWNFIVRYTITNVGKSPAFRVNLLATMIPMGDLQPNPPPPNGFAFDLPTKAVDAEVETTCGFFDGETSFIPNSRPTMAGVREIIFPNVPQNRRWRPHSKPVGPGFIPGFIIMGCATYKFAGDHIPHRTVRIFDLERRAYGQMIDVRTETTTTNDLALIPYPENGSRAD
jgi:hypothetical protein